MRAREACALMRARRGPGAAAHGSRLLLHEVGPNRWRARGAVAGKQNGPAPPPRSARPSLRRILSEGRGAVHAYSGPSSRGASVGHEEARRTWEGGDRGPPGLTIFYYPTGRGPNTKGAQTPAKPRPMGCASENPLGPLPCLLFGRGPTSLPDYTRARPFAPDRHPGAHLRITSGEGVTPPCRPPL